MLQADEPNRTKKLRHLLIEEYDLNDLFVRSYGIVTQEKGPYVECWNKVEQIMAICTSQL